MIKVRQATSKAGATAPNTADRRRLVTLVHVAKRDLQMDEEAYRATLRAATGKSSTTEMSVPQLERAVDHMKRCGFKVRPASPPGKPRHTAMDQSAQASKLRAVWLDLASLGIVKDPSEAALALWVKRETSVEAIQWLNAQQLSSTIEKIKKWHDRILRDRNRALWAALGIARPVTPADREAARQSIRAAAERILGRPAEPSSMHQTDYQTLRSALART